MTKLDESALRKVLEVEFKIEVAAMHFLQNENDDVWRIDGRGGESLLARVSNATTSDRSTAPTRADHLDALSALLGDVPTLRRTATGAAESSTILSTKGTHRVEVTRWVPGWDVESWDPELANRAGVALARFAKANEDLPLPGAGWRSYAPSAIVARAEQLLSAEPRWRPVLSALKPVAGNLDRRLGDASRVIHGDLHRENFVVDGEAVRIIDLTDLGVGSPWYDLASALSSLTRLGNDAIPAAFATGYRTSARDIPDAETMSALITMRDLAIATHLVTTADPVALTWVPARLAELAENCRIAAAEGAHPALRAYAKAD